MPSLDLGEVRAVPWRLVAAGANTDGPLAATRFLSAMDSKRLRLPSDRAPATVGGMAVLMQIVAPRMGNQIHDEHPILADEQWSSRREQLASPGRCTTVTI
jgi:hypothetical protein